MRYPRTFLIGIALVVATPLAACSDGQAVTAAPPAPSAAAPSESPAPSKEPSAAPTGKAKKPKPKAPSASNLSALRSAGIKAGGSILIDVADDGEDRFLAVGKGGVVDFTGTGRTDDTMMSLQPAAVSAPNRVVIKPPFYNEDLGDGQCVADTAGAPLKLEACKAGKASQIWRVALAGDSGQFELHGAYGVIRVDGSRITTDGNGRTGLQVLPFVK